MGEIEKKASRAPLITVVMPAYNASKFIRQSIESILNQNFQRFELIIIDDCSQDDTYRILQEYKHDPQVRIYRNLRRLGDAATRNRILRLARGKYIAPNDADDIMLQGRLKEQCGFLEKNPKAGVVFGKALTADENMKSILYLIAPKTRAGAFIGRSGFVKELPVAFNHGTALIRKPLMFKAGLYEASLPMGVDSRLMRRIFRIAPFYFLNKFCFIYRQQSQSICRSRLREARSAMNEIFRRKEKKELADLIFYINGQWIKIKPKSEAMAKTLGWRLNFYSWQARRHGSLGKKRFVVWEDGLEKANQLSDPERFRRGFLMPFAARLREKEKVLLTDAGLVSFHEKGILIFGEEEARAEIILSFLNRDFHYHSSNNPILYSNRGDVCGESFIDPLMISKPIFKGGSRHESWGQFWNPIVGKYFLNVCFYRTYLIGSQCLISQVIFIQRAPSEARIKKERLDFKETLSFLRASGNLAPETGKILERVSRQASIVLIKAPKNKSPNMALDIKI